MVFFAQRLYCSWSSFCEWYCCAWYSAVEEMSPKAKLLYLKSLSQCQYLTVCTERSQHSIFIVSQPHCSSSACRMHTTSLGNSVKVYWCWRITFEIASLLCLFLQEWRGNWWWWWKGFLGDWRVCSFCLRLHSPFILHSFCLLYHFRSQ